MNCSSKKASFIGSLLPCDKCWGATVLTQQVGTKHYLCFREISTAKNKSDETWIAQLFVGGLNLSFGRFYCYIQHLLSKDNHTFVIVPSFCFFFASAATFPPWGRKLVTGRITHAVARRVTLVFVFIISYLRLEATVTTTAEPQLQPCATEHRPWRSCFIAV